MGMDKPLEDLVGDTKQGYWAIALKVFLRLLRLWDSDYQRSSPDFGNFEWAQAGRKESHNQDFKAAPAWSIRYRKIESGPDALLGCI